MVLRVLQNKLLEKNGGAKFTVVPLDIYFEGFKKGLYSIGRVALNPHKYPVRPFLLFFDIDIDKLPGYLARVRECDQHVFGPPPRVLRFQRPYGVLPSSVVSDSVLLVWDSGFHFKSWEQYNVWAKQKIGDLKMPLHMTTEAYMPLPGFIDRPMLQTLRSPPPTDFVDFGWQPVPLDDFEGVVTIKTVADFSAYIPSCVRPDSVLLGVDGGDRIDLEHIPIADELENRGPDHCPPVLAIMQELRKVDETFEYVDGSLRRQSNGKVAKFKSPNRMWKCCNGNTHEYQDGYIWAQWDDIGNVTLKCCDFGTRPVRPTCPDYQFAYSVKAEIEMRWMKTYRCLVKHNLNRLDMPITRTDWGIYLEDDIRKFFEKLDPRFDFDRDFGYHPEPDKGAIHAFRFDLIEKFKQIGRDEATKEEDPSTCFDYLHFFYGVIDQFVVCRQRFDYLKMKFTDMKNIGMTQLSYRARNSRGVLVSKPILAEWLASPDRRTYLRTTAAPLSLKRFLQDDEEGNSCNILRPGPALQIQSCLDAYLASDMWRPWIDYYCYNMLYMLCGNEENEERVKCIVEVAKTWVGRLFCEFGSPMHVFFVTIGAAGAGKSSLCNFVASALGSKNVHKDTIKKMLDESFNIDRNKPLIVLEETKSKIDERFAAYDEQFKDLITQERWTGKAKWGSNSIDLLNISNMLGSANPGGQIAGVTTSNNRRVQILNVMSDENRARHIQTTVKPVCSYHECVESGRCVHSPVDDVHFLNRFNKFREDPAFLGLMIGYFVNHYVENDDHTRMQSLIVNSDAIVAQQLSRESPFNRFYKQCVELDSWLPRNPSVLGEGFELLLPLTKIDPKTRKPVNNDPNEGGFHTRIGVDSLWLLYRHYLKDAGLKPGTKIQMQEAFDQLVSKYANLSKKLGKVSTQEVNIWRWRSPQVEEDGETAKRWVKNKDAFSVQVVYLPKGSHLSNPDNRNQNGMARENPADEQVFKRSSVGLVMLGKAAAHVDGQAMDWNAFENSQMINRSSSRSRSGPIENDEGDGEPDNGSPINSRRALLEDLDENAQHADCPSSYEEDSWLEKDVPSKKRNRKDTERDANSSPSKVPKDKEEVDGDDDVVLAGDSE